MKKVLAGGSSKIFKIPLAAEGCINSGCQMIITLYGLSNGFRESVLIISLLSSREMSAYKVMIIWQPELMHPSAANGILKILEEPPANTFFILVTNSMERLLPTIISRTQMVQVPLLSDEEVESHLISRGQTDEVRRNEIVRLAEGDLNAAL